jgi:hypothetical protein
VNEKNQGNKEQTLFHKDKEKKNMENRERGNRTAAIFHGKIGRQPKRK